ncbi:MAG: CobD/CbiB family cobalamin biosynthesis protein, partial [Oscillospiraceae bacterium]
MKLMFILFAAYLLDLIFGDPHWLFHPICLIGNAISRGEKWIRLRFSKDEKGERRAGTVLAIFIVSMSFLLPLFLLMALKWIHPMISFIVEIFFCYQILATKSLRTESMKVYDALQRNDILEAQKFLSWIVGRDTENLTEAEIIKATVETVAENTSDGVIAPMIFMA